MKKIDIQITKAKINSFSVELKEDLPVVSATIGLLTEGGKQITTYTIYSQNWNEDQKFDLPIEMIIPIKTIMDDLEKIVVKHLRNNQLQITE